jgi:hypothetical protein
VLGPFLLATRRCEIGQRDNPARQQSIVATRGSGKKYIVEGQRLEVNPSVDRYKREMANLSAAL